MTARARQASARSPAGWLALALGFGALAALCFVAGVVIAVFLEEPALLVDRAAGRSVTVPLEGRVATAPARVAPEARATRSAPVPARPRVGAPRAGHAIQVGAFAERAAAEGLARSLGEEGLPVYLVPSEGSDARWRVRVGPYASEPEAERVAARLAQRRLPTWVLEEAGR